MKYAFMIASLGGWGNLKVFQRPGRNHEREKARQNAEE
jgi:hypothetical protein